MLFSIMMRLTHCLLVACILGYVVANEEFFRYQNFKVWEVTPNSNSQTVVLHELKNKFGLDFWESPFVGRKSRISVSPEFQIEFQQALDEQQIPASIIIQDLERVFETERRERLLRDALSKRMKQFARSLNKRHSVDFHHYWSFDEMMEYIDESVEENPEQVEKFFVANTTLGRENYGLKFSLNGTVSGERPILFFDCGVHAREWIAPMQCMYIIHEFCDHPYDYMDILESVDLIVVPVVNPDGYEHSRESVRLWRKTRRPNPGSTCVGTDGNRNYGFQWAESSNACSEAFSGPEPFSEPEIAGIRDTLLEYAHKIKVYVSVHSYGNWMLYPWGYDSILISNWEDHDELGHDFANAIQNATGTTYTVGNSAILLYPAAGGSDDYAASIGVPLAYTLELPGGGDYGFDLPANRIQAVVAETMNGIRTLGLHIANTYGNNK